MNTGLRITAFAAALTAAFGAAYGVGKGVDPVVENTAPAAHDTHGRTSPAAREGGGHAARESALAAGVQISENGYTLDLATPRVSAGERTTLRFTVRDEAGRAVTAFRREHGKELHLILASRDLTTYRHLHPERAADGTWSAPVELPRAGGYRVFADFTPAREGAGNLTLGADLAAAGRYAPRELPAPAATARTGGYEVELAGTLRPGRASGLTLKVSRDGRPVTDLQPYLGAYGHLVALRSGDLAYLHVHPGGEPGDGTTKPGPAVSFTATAPSGGTYRLFLDFRHEGRVHTAAFTVRAEAPETAERLSGTAEERPGRGDGHSGGHGH
ncbi:hypothetical protein GTU99_05975 [Streptomyces sp. PRKS01-65]|nr:hypothetical protein [Streptomyces harenosi]NEY31749.1 hypothetical protein [Streptomyces harenosi]